LAEKAIAKCGSGLYQLENRRSWFEELYKIEQHGNSPDGILSPATFNNVLDEVRDVRYSYGNLRSGG
jgi:hypothetical protein